jgi:hypothetical protein
MKPPAGYRSQPEPIAGGGFPLFRNAEASIGDVGQILQPLC